MAMRTLELRGRLTSAALEAFKNWFVATWVVLAGCGGGGGDSASAPTPSNLAYASPQTYTVGKAISPLAPTVTGTVTGYSVAPALPGGLSLDPFSGVISGTPAAAKAAADYLVTAFNGSGSTSFSLSVAVEPGVLHAADDAATTVKGISTTIFAMDNDGLGPNAPVSITSVTQPTNGSTSIFGGTTIAYTPNSGFVGTDVFGYTLRDAAGATSAASVTVTVADITELRLHPNGRIARLVTPLATIWDTATADAKARSVANKLYGYFSDNFDFIIVLGIGDSNTLLLPGQPEGIHLRARNDVQGIGQPIFDSTSQFGSSGRLRGVVALNRRNGLRLGPSLHELLHCWANYAVDTGLPGHWNFSSSGGGQLGGFDGATLKDLGGGRYQATNGRPGAKNFGPNANGGNSVPYSDIELYLMGMRDAQGTPDVLVANSPAPVDPANGVFSATGFTTHTIDSIIARLGPRVPAFASSPKSFKILIVALARAELGDAEFNSLDDDVRLFGFPGDDGRTGEYNFWEATRGVGSLTVDGLAADLR